MDDKKTPGDAAMTCPHWSLVEPAQANAQATPDTSQALPPSRPRAPEPPRPAPPRPRAREPPRPRAPAPASPRAREPPRPPAFSLGRELREGPSRYSSDQVTPARP